MKPSVRPSTLGDAIALAKDLRPEDVAECRAADGKSPIGALVAGLQTSHRCFTVVYNGKPAAMFGVVKSAVDPTLGYVWLLGSPAIADFSKEFLRQSQEWLETVSEGYDVLTNVVDVRNDSHLRWLEWLGFEFGPVEERYGPEERPFIRVKKYFGKESV